MLKIGINRMRLKNIGLHGFLHRDIVALNFF